MDLCFFAVLVIPNSSLPPWKCCWGCGATLLDPRVGPGLGTGKQKVFCVGLRLLWLHPLWSSPCWVLVAVGCLPKGQGRPWKCSCGSCGLWLQIWGIFTPQATAAPWDISRLCRKACRKLLPRLVLPLELSLFWFIQGNPSCSCSPCGAEGWEFPGLFPSSQGSPVGSQSCSQFFSLLLGCVSCLNIPGEEFSQVGTPGQVSRWMHCRNSHSEGHWAEPVDPQGLPMFRSMFLSIFSPLQPGFVTGLCCMDTGNVCGTGCVSGVFPVPPLSPGSGNSFSKQD